MSNQPNRPKLASILEGVATKLKADFDNINKAVDHNPSKGKEREKAVMNFLREYLPERFGLTNGEIVSTDGQTSSECDVIIYDAHACPVLKTGDYQIIPVEAAYAVVEVKSKLTTDELLRSAKNIETIKKMPKTAFYPMAGPITRSAKIYGRDWNYYPMLGFVFAYTSIDLDTLSAKLDESYQSTLPEHRIDYVCTLDSGGLIHVHVTPFNSVTLWAGPGTRIGNLPSDNPLLAFLVFLQNLVLQAWTDPVRLGDYLGDESFGIPRYPVAQADQQHSN